jgi:hypothetical protein
MKEGCVDSLLASGTKRKERKERREEKKRDEKEGKIV